MDTRRDDVEYYERRRPPVSPEIRELRTEIRRIYREIDELRYLLDSQRDKLNYVEQGKNMVVTASIDEEQIESIKKSIDGIEAKITSIDNNINSNIKSARDEIDDNLDEHIQSLSDKLKGIMANLNGSGVSSEFDKVNDTISDKFNEKFGSKNIGDVLRRVNVLQSFVMANMIGTIILLIIMCYLILSIS